MRFYQIEDYPKRVYMDCSEEDLDKLSLAICHKLGIDVTAEGDISHVVFKDTEKGQCYFPLGIVNIILSIANANGVEVKEVLLLPTQYDTLAGGLLREDMLTGITLRDYQMEGTHAGLYHKSGLLQIPTGGGKTEMMSAVTMYLLENTSGNILIGVPSTNLLIQTYERLILRGISVDDISMLGGGNNPDLSKRVLVSTVQSAYNRVNKKNAEFLEWTGNVVGLLLDEAHHGASRTWYTLADSIFSEYTLGFSAEPFYGDADNVVRDMLLRGTLGSILYRIPLKVLINRGYLSHPYVFAFRSLYGGNIQRVSNWQTVYKAGIVQNTLRNAMIVEISDYLININKAPLILVQQVQHGRDLAMEISKHGHKVAVLTGGQMVAVFHHGNLVDEYFDPEEKSKEDFKNGIIQGLVGTSVLDEGVDMPSIASVILAGGGKSKLKLIQRIGRGLRPKEIDNTTFIIDFQDAFNKMTGNHFKQRKEQFDKNQFDTFFVQDMAAFNYLVSQVKKGQEKTQ